MQTPSTPNAARLVKANTPCYKLNKLRFDSICLRRYLVERGSSAVECRTRNLVSPGSNPPLLPFLPVEAKSVKLFERSNGLDTALYKHIPFTFF